MTEKKESIRNFHYVKVYYTNGNKVKYRNFPMEAYENGLKVHTIRDIKPLNGFETLIMDILEKFGL